MFKVNNKNTKTMTVDFEQVNVSWVCTNILSVLN